MKKIVLIAFILLFSLTVLALSLDTNSVRYEQGEKMSFFGSCTSGTSLQLTAVMDVIHIFSSELKCSKEGKYSFEYDSSFTDAPGNWIIKAVSNEGTVVKKISMLRARNASFFLVSFLSPSSNEIFLANDLNIVVQVSDKGKPVDEAVVYFFDLDGQKRKMNFISNGTYLYEYTIPFNSDINSWNLLVLSEKEGENPIGGYGSMQLNLVPAVISVELIEPVFSSYDLSQEIPVKVKATYFNGKPLNQPKVFLKIKDREIYLEQLDFDTFYLNYSPDMLDIGSLTLTVNAFDSAGNSGNISKIIQTKGELLFILKENMLLIFAAAVLIVLIVLLFSNKISRASLLNKQGKEEKELTQKIKELQEDYFLNQRIGTEEYKKLLAEYTSRLNAAKEKISRIKK
ncbi:MAG: hypothetical protein JW703_00185 [Candidatus Diapherotrites archaeon]|nr:hypothetical protein [Candidatus Diapherotrites archaeon]